MDEGYCRGGPSPNWGVPARYTPFGGRGPLWVRLGHSAMSAQCPVCRKADTTGFINEYTPKAEPASIPRRPRTFLHRLPRAGAPSWIGRRRFPSQVAQSTGTLWRIEGLAALCEGFAFGATRGSQSNTFASSHRWKCER